MAKLITAREAAALIEAGSRVMFGGFLGCGNALDTIDALSKTGKAGFTMICDDCARPNGPDGEDYYGVAKLIHNHQVSTFIGSHVGTNSEVSQQMQEGTLDVQLVPMGSFVEMIRAGGSGLGGVIAPTGLGTEVENSPLTHSKLTIDGRAYLVMRPLRADYAVISGFKVDTQGNVWYKGTTRNFAPWMAMAADTVIVEAENLVEPGQILPEDVVTPGILVDYIVVKGGGQHG